MRPQQQNRRMRGRGNNNNNNRKGPNPLTRSYESNGPDVKIRGSAQQVAEKYTTLARDAQSAGDRVMAENYLQHAEHYNRIIAAAMAQQAIQQQQQRDIREDSDDDSYDDDRDTRVERQDRSAPDHQQSVDADTPQPVIEGIPAEVAYRSEAAEEPQSNGEAVGHVNGAQHAAAEIAPEADEAPRKPRRTRRPRQPRETQPDVAQASEAGSGNPAEAVGQD